MNWETTQSFLLPWAFILFLTSTAFAAPGDNPPAQETPPPTRPLSEKVTVPLNLPDPTDIPATPQGEAIRYGEQLVRHTQANAKDFVGNGLNCTNCHLQAGQIPYAMPYVGLSGVYPQYRTRSGKVISLQERVNGCFRRSLNGKPLPLDSPEMNAIISYIGWLSQGVPLGADVWGRGVNKLAAPASPPDPVRGKKLFARICARCHGLNGAGKTGPKGDYQFPPLWGDKSFNIGAGMARLNTAAAFIKANMPPDKSGSLSEQEAYDIAAYFTRQPRPDFPDKVKDWPKGGKPPDARY